MAGRTASSPSSLSTAQHLLQQQQVSSSSNGVQPSLPPSAPLLLLDVAHKRKVNALCCCWELSADSSSAAGGGGDLLFEAPPMLLLVADSFQDFCLQGNTSQLRVHGALAHLQNETDTLGGADKGLCGCNGSWHCIGDPELQCEERHPRSQTAKAS